MTISARRVQGTVRSDLSLLAVRSSCPLSEYFQSCDEYDAVPSDGNRSVGVFNRSDRLRRMSRILDYGGRSSFSFIRDTRVLRPLHNQKTTLAIHKYILQIRKGLEIKFGVPQGMILSPLLFAVLINDRGNGLVENPHLQSFTYKLAISLNKYL